MHENKRPLNGVNKPSKNTLIEQEERHTNNEPHPSCVTAVKIKAAPKLQEMVKESPAEMAQSEIQTDMPVKEQEESKTKESNKALSNSTPSSLPELSTPLIEINEESDSKKETPLLQTSSGTTQLKQTKDNGTTQTQPQVQPHPQPHPPNGAPMNYCARRTWITTDRLNELRRKAQEAAKQNKIFTIRGCFNSVRNALIARGWVEKLDVHRKVMASGQMTYEDLTQRLPKRKAGETRRQYVLKCERNIMSRFLEHMPIDFLWTNRKEKCDFIDQAKNPGMTINKFHRAPFTSKEGLCSQLRDFHWFFEEGTAEMYFPRCYNVWSPEELGEFVDNFKLTACVAFLRCLVDKCQQQGGDAVFALSGKIPYSSIDFAYKRCMDFIESCQHNDIDLEDPPKIWEHDWDAFLYQHQQFVQEDMRIQHDNQRGMDCMLKSVSGLVDKIQMYWPQYTLDGYQNLWIVKPANKCRGRGIILMDNLKKILGVVNPSIASKSRYVVQKYIERPLILFQTKFDIRQWFLITNTQPLVIWMYRESYLRFSSQEYSLTNHHESVHLTNYAIQKKYTNGKRDKRLPSENMWDCYSFQAYLRQIGKYSMWMERIYPGMRKAIVGTMLASQENMDRRPNTFELFGADFMICENFYPWLIEINSSPDLGATTSVTARMCPQCLEDVVKVVIDRRTDPKSELGNFELIYRQVVPPTPAYMGLNLFVKGKQLITKVNHNHNYYYQRKERTLQTSSVFRQRSAALIPTSMSRIHRAMPTFNATEYMEKCMVEPLNSNRSSISTLGSNQAASSSLISSNSGRQKPPAGPVVPASLCPYLLKQTQGLDASRRSLAQFISASTKRNKSYGQPDTPSANATVPPKRQRSCGPRLNSITRDGAEKKFKIMIKPFGRSSSSAPHASTSRTSKSENNLLTLYESTKQVKTKLLESTTNNTNRTTPAASPAVQERKWRSLRNIATSTKTKSVTSTPIVPGVIPHRLTRTKSEIESTTTMHAIGRNFGGRRSNGRCPITPSSAQAPKKPTITSNAYENISPIIMKPATSEIAISATAHVISPRTTSHSKTPLNSTL